MLEKAFRESENNKTHFFFFLFESKLLSTYQMRLLKKRGEAKGAHEKEPQEKKKKQ